ncbi:protein kinase, partial [Sulfurimonas sp. SAG-AH-194-I05]
MSKVLKKIDEFSNIHYIEKDNELGRGGQGVVYKTKNADTVIKIALNNDIPIKNEKKIKAFHQKIKKLIYKPLPNDINIAKPLVVLKEEAGYVMHLLNGMEPFAELLPQELKKEQASKIEIPNFLKEVDERSAIYFTHYLQTGGLRKRLYSLSRLAIILYRLHSRGIVYFDISHNNIFINKDDIPLVYLIDADNIEYESANKDVVYTPNFEVPEVVKGDPNSTYSDIYAFGILSYLAITTTHPFDGIGLEEDDWDSEGGETKEKWELPWTEDSNDDSNKSTSGLKGTLTITQELSYLFHKLFEEGKDNKYKRLTLPLWIESLEKAACKTLKCSGCSMSYYDDIFDACPYCQTKKTKRLIIKSFYYK